jgi:hypothetical protein
MIIPLICSNAGQPFQLGLATGNQVNWSLIKDPEVPDQDRLSLFFNGRADVMGREATGPPAPAARAGA